MRLEQLEARFLRWYVGIADKGHGRPRGDGTTQWGGFEVDCFQPVKLLGQAHGIRFLCPKSFAANGGAKGTHQVRVFFEGSPVPPHIGRNKEGQPQRWRVSGSGISDLTLEPSIQEQDDGLCGWHGHVRGGDAA